MPAAAGGRAPPSSSCRFQPFQQSQDQDTRPSKQSQPQSARPYVPPYDEGRSDTTGPRLLYNGQQSNYRRDTNSSSMAGGLAGLQTSPCRSQSTGSGHIAATMGIRPGTQPYCSGRSRDEGYGSRHMDAPFVDATSSSRDRLSVAGPPAGSTTGFVMTAPSQTSMLPGDTPFGIRMPRGIPHAHNADNNSNNNDNEARGSSSPSPAGNSSGISSQRQGRFSVLVPPPNSINITTGSFRPSFGNIQTRLASPSADVERTTNGNALGVEAIYQVGGALGGNAIAIGPGSPPRSPTNAQQAPPTTPASYPRSPSSTAISTTTRSPSVSPRALPAMAVSTRTSSFRSQGISPTSSPVSATSRARNPSASSAYTRPSLSGQTYAINDNHNRGAYDSNTEGMETSGYASSYVTDYETNMDDSRTYETGTIGSGTYQSSTIAMTRSYSYTATLGDDEETATYLSGTIASQTIQTAQTDGSGTYGQSFDSTYQTSRETYDTGEDTEVDYSRGQRSNHGKKSKLATKLNRWKRSRWGNTEDMSTYDTDGHQGKPFDYAAFRGDKEKSKSRGRSGSATSPRSSKEILSTSPSGVSLGTAEYINAQVVRKERIDYENTQQQHGYLAILLTLIQTLILAAMMAFCGAAPLKINWSIGPYPDALSEFGAKNPYLMIEMNEWWRFFTPQLLNTGVIQLLCNAYVQLETAAFYEREWGSSRWGIIYFCSAVGSTIVGSILDPNTIGVSSSSALMGIFGAKLAEVLTLTIFDTFYRRDGAAFQHLGGTLCSLVTVCLFCAAPHNDWSGHIGGLATGFFLGMALFGKYIRKLHLKAAWQLLGLAIFVACLGTAINELVNYVTPSDATGDACTYYKSIFMDQDYNCQCQIGNLYASGSYNYGGDDGYAAVDDMVNDDDGYGYNDDGSDDDGEGEEGNQDQNDQQQENGEKNEADNNGREGEADDGEREEDRGEERGR